MHNKDNDTFIISRDECRRILGYPIDEDITIKPKDIPSNHRLFVQSTSHNRKIPKDTHVLFKVPIREALRYRMASTYSFL